MICSQCASQMTDDCHFCPQCGQATALAQEPAETSSHTRNFAAAEAAPASGKSVGPDAADDPIEVSGSLSSSAMVPTPPALDDKALHTLLTEANLLRVRGRWDEAVDRCVEVLRAQPGNHTAHSLLGDIYRDQGKTDDAIQWYRMAVDLKPNPSDSAKLKQMERERGRSAPKAGRGMPGALIPVTPDGSMPAGTAALMGISPRSWLRGITIASLAFLTIVLIGMIGVLHSRRREAVVPRPMSFAEPALTNSNSILPPPDLRGAAQAGAGPTYDPDQNLAGRGLRADGPNAVVPTDTTPRQPKSTEGAVEDNNYRPIGPAPVTGVMPSGEQNMPGFAPPPNQSSPKASLQSVAQSLQLPGGMRVAQISKNASGSGVEIDIVSPAHALAAPSRSLMVRNIYRASRAVFAADTAITRAEVGISAENSSDTLFSAEIDRLSALDLSPDSTALEKLEAALHSQISSSSDSTTGSNSSGDGGASAGTGSLDTRQ